MAADELSSLQVRAKPLNAPDAAFAWENYFEWTGDQWNLVFEWRTDPEQSLTLEYIVDRPEIRPRGDLGRVGGDGRARHLPHRQRQQRQDAEGGEQVDVGRRERPAGTWNDEPTSGRP